MYILDKPEYLHLLWFLILFIGLFIGWHIWRRKTKATYFNSSTQEQILSNASSLKHVYKQVLFILIFILCTFALVNPKAGTKTRKVKQKGLDVVFMQDISKSMDAEDISPSRLIKSKNIITKILDKLDMDKAGLIVYAGNAYPLVPMTADYGAIKTFLTSVDTDLMTSKGTALNAAFSTARRFLYGGKKTEKQNNKVVVLLSDGEDHQNFSPKSIKDILPNTRVVSIGLGTEEGAPIPANKNRNARHYKKDKQGHVVISKLQSNVLRAIANHSEGLFMATDNSTEAATIFKKFIDKIERTEGSESEITDYEYQYEIILLIALVLLIIDSSILYRKTKWIKLNT